MLQQEHLNVKFSVPLHVISMKTSQWGVQNKSHAMNLTFHPVAAQTALYDITTGTYLHVNDHAGGPNILIIYYVMQV